MTPLHRRAAWTLALLATLALVGSCSSGRRAGPQSGAAAAAADSDLAERLFARMQEEQAAGRDRAALSLGYELIDHHQSFPRMADVVRLAAASARRLGERDEALRLTGDYLAAHPDSPAAASLLELRADMLLEAGDGIGATDDLVRLYDMQTTATGREEVGQRLAAAAVDLDADDIATLRASHADSAARPLLGYLWTQKLLAEHRNDEAGDAVSALRTESPGDSWTARAEELLENPDALTGAEQPPQPAPGGVDASHVAVLCPLTGRYTVLGNAFYDGVRLAGDEAAEQGWPRYELTVHDTEGDPVSAALAMRRLAAESPPIAVVGCLLSAPTATAALVADTTGMTLVSPTATNPRLRELGPAIFQTNVTGGFEARLLARLAVRVLLKRRIAVLYPDEPDGLRSFETFAGEVADLGGTLVAAESFDVGMTDFREPLRKIAAALPEVLFVPADVDQMILLGPQLDFYRAGALIMGPSSWDSQKLAAQVGGILDRAVFPSDTALYPAAWTERFAASWDTQNQPDEATAIARQAYLASLLVFDTLGEKNPARPAELATALAERLDLSRNGATDRETMASALRMFSGGDIVPFPLAMYDDAFAPPDTTAAAAADSAGAPAPAPGGG